MALSDLAVYSEYAYTAMTEVLDQQVNAFNEASQGTIILDSGVNQGDFTDRIMYGKIASGTVRRRNPYGTGAAPSTTVSNIIDTTVKVAAGTPTLKYDASEMAWILQDPKLAGVVFGEQLAKDYMADMLNTSLGCCVAALNGQAPNIQDITGAAAPADLISPLAQNDAVSLFGDSGQRIQAWIMHSKPWYNLIAHSLTNAERLFFFNTINVYRDFAGRVFVVTDSPSLKASTVYNTLGLTQSALTIQQNNDFYANEQVLNGQENIAVTYQAEWSYNLGIKGFSWDKANGGKAPNDAALMTSSNWDKYVTSKKDLAGVLLKSH